MGGTLAKLLIGAFFVGLSSQMTSLVQDVLVRVNMSIQASELLTVDGHLQVWSIEQRRTRPPRGQEEFEEIVRNRLIARGREVTRDRWDEPYLYQTVRRTPLHWRIISKGPDRALGTADDLVVERVDDAVEINKDPEQLASGAEARIKGHRTEVLRSIRKLAGELVASTDEQEGVLGEDDPGADRAEQQRRTLEQGLTRLDELLDS